MSQRLIEAVRNLKTSKLFILLDEVPGRFKLVNPEGVVVSLPETLFDEDPVVIPFGEAEQFEFSEAQLQFYAKHLAALEEKEAKEHIAIQQTKERKKREAAIPKRVPTRTSTAGRKKPREDNRVGLAASWSGASLSFYKPQIDRLGPKQSFKVKVNGVGDFVISKQDFLNVFSDVVLSANYKSSGFFAYREIPDKAMRFLKVDSY